MADNPFMERLLGPKAKNLKSSAPLQHKTPANTSSLPSVEVKLKEASAPAPAPDKTPALPKNEKADDAVESVVDRTPDQPSKTAVAKAKASPPAPQTKVSSSASKSNSSKPHEKSVNKKSDDIEASNANTSKKSASATPVKKPEAIEAAESKQESRKTNVSELKPAEKTNDDVTPASPPKAEPVKRKPSKAAALIAAKKAQMESQSSGTPAKTAARRPTAKALEVKEEKPKDDLEKMTSEQLWSVIEESGALLTGPGGAYERRPEQRELMALFESGLFLVSRSHMDDPHVVSFAGLLRRKGMQIQMVPCEISLLTRCYDEGGQHEDQVMKADDEATSMQREIVRFIAECARLKASDAHVVVSHDSAIVRLRIDGVLKDHVEWRSAYGSDFCAAAFAMADASDASYQPYEYQAARISDTSVRLPGGVQALRLQFNPLSYGGRHMVARFLYRTQGIVGDVDTLGYAEKQIVQIKRMRAVPMGINIVAGPTGSGKSTTLQRILSTLMQERKNEIATFTVEDPPEYVIEGAQQMPVTNASTADERKEKFNAAIRAALRSDPDVIMIGEIRDEESAKLAFEAAMTGHQVWATLHAVDALTILSRLKDINVDEFKLYDPAVFTGMVGQRLTRALCDNCKIPFMQARDQGKVDDELWERTLSIYSRDVEGIYMEGEGCVKCNGTGVVGRSVVAEVCLPDDTLMEHMKNEDKISARRHWVENLNGITMMGHGILKAKAGVCSPYEVERMLGPMELDRNRVRKVAAE